MMISFFEHLFLNLFILVIFFNKTLTFDYSDFTKNTLNDSLEECDVCKLLSNSFSSGIEKTKRGNFDGGDTTWEESRLKNYADSELRLTEIQETLCLELKNGKHQCLSLAEKIEEEIEFWWHRKRKENINLFEFLCVNKLEYCCLDGYYGKNCDKCKGYPNNICEKNGKCNGSGTRKGDGTCICNVGFMGKSCSICGTGFLKINKTCLSCDASCKNDCTELGPKGCVECKEGFEYLKNEGCVNINECLIPEYKNQCLPNTYCKNNYRSSSYLDFAKVCKTSFNSGLENCIECHKNYEKRKWNLQT